jgi:hypothetical protein
MTFSIFVLFSIQLIVTFLGWLLFFRKLNVPFGPKFLAITAYLTSPIAIIIKGSQSAIYASDLIAPILLIYFIIYPNSRRALRAPSFFVLCVLLLILPFSMGFFHGIAEGGGLGFGSRDVKGDIVWIYRNLTYISVFGFGLSTRMTREEYGAFLQLNVGLGMILGLFGVLHYYGPYNLAVFEQYAIKGWESEGYVDTHAGLGFMGIFRASVGQWFATLIVLILGGYQFLSWGYRKVAWLLFTVSAGVIALSYSRAGFLGMIIGIVLVSVFSGSARQRWIGIFAIGPSTIWLFMASDALTERMTSIVTGAHGAHVRSLAWERAIDFLTSNPTELVLGVGPTNRQRVFEITGAYGAHNEYIDVIFRLGIPGLVVLAAFIIFLLRDILRKTAMLDKKSRTIVTSLLVVVIMNCFIGFTQANLIQDYSGYTVGFYLYLLYGIAAGSTLLPDARS